MFLIEFKVIKSAFAQNRGFKTRFFAQFHSSQIGSLLFQFHRSCWALSALFNSVDPVWRFIRPWSNYGSTRFDPWLEPVWICWPFLTDDYIMLARVEIFHLIWSKTWAVWAVFFRQLRSKSCIKMSGLSGFWTVYLKKPLKPRKIWTVYPKKNRSNFARFLSGWLEKPFKNRSNRSFWCKILR